MPAPVNLPIKPLDSKEQAPKATGRIINNVTFFGDSAIPEGDPIYTSVFEAAKFLAKNDYTIVDGGGPGIMKAATDGAESVHGQTVAVYWQPKLASFFEGKNLANVTDESSTASNYVMRTFELIEKGDAYVVCKGGTGTVSEFGLVWCLAKLYYGCHKPVILYGDFWDDLIEAFQRDMYIDETELGVLYQATTPEQVLNLLKDHEKKIQHCTLKKYEGDETAFIIGARESSKEVRLTTQAYNQGAADYHSTHAGKLSAQDQLDEFIKLVNPPAQVLDIGCGPGFDTKYLSEKYSVTGVEIAEKFVDIAQYENPKAKIVLGDIVTTDIGKNKYKGIWARDSIHHIPEKDQNKVFEKIYNALVDGGIFYTLVREGEGEIYEESRTNYTKTQKFYHQFTPAELTKRAELAGFKMIKIDHTKRSHQWLIGVFQK